MASKISSRSVYSWEVLLCLGGEEAYLGFPDTDHSTVISGLYREASGHTTVSGCSDLLEQVYVIVISWPPRQTRKPTFPSRAGNAPQSPFWPPRNSFACCWLWRQRLVPMCTRPLISHPDSPQSSPQYSDTWISKFPPSLKDQPNHLDCFHHICQYFVAFKAKTDAQEFIGSSRIPMVDQFVTNSILKRN